MKPPRLLLFPACLSVLLTCQPEPACAQSPDPGPVLQDAKPQGIAAEQKAPESVPLTNRFTPPAPRSLPPELPPLPSFPSRKTALPDFSEFDVRTRINSIATQFGPNATENAAAQQRLRARYREIKARALEDPAVGAELAAAQNAHSDREMRDALKRHYTLLFERMRRTDPSLRAIVAEREAEIMTSMERTPPKMPPRAASLRSGNLR